MLRTPRSPRDESASAVRVFRTMLRDTVAPALRELGFTGSGSSFALPPNPDGDYALLGIQGDRYNDASLARFTLDLAFYTAAEWTGIQADAAQQGRKSQSKPSLNQQYFCGWQQRVGYLYQPAHDHWWAVRDEAEAQLVAADVIRVVGTYAVPQLWARLAHEDPPPTFSDGTRRGDPCPWPHCFDNDDTREDD
jgi:hypothetical protein